jgi:hypothetical protein
MRRFKMTFNENITLEEQIVITEALVAQAVHDFTEAQKNNDPLLFVREQELIELQTRLNALIMRKPV